MDNSNAQKDNNSSRLGKGLSALLSPSSLQPTSTYYNENFDIAKIAPNPYQPRMRIQPEELIEIADSIREHGVIQPLIITKDTNSDNYFLIAGERRFRAAQMAGLTKVPVVIKDSSPQEMLELALIENIQRKDLNPLEEGTAFKQLQDMFGMTQRAIAHKVGLSRVAVTNKIRLLSLPNPVREAIMNEQISEGHARALLGLEDKESLIAATNIIIRKNLSVRETEQLVRKINFGKEVSKKQINELSMLSREFADKLSKKLGYTAKIVKLNTGGKITIRFQSDEELEKIMGKLL